MLIDIHPKTRQEIQILFTPLINMGDARTRVRHIMLNGNFIGKAFSLLSLVISQMALSPQTPLNGTIYITSLIYVRGIFKLAFCFLSQK
jgi:hypothetical protein